MLHSVYGPSSAARWIGCPGSIAASAELPEPPESPYAAEGHAAHALAEKALKEGKQCSELTDDVEMAEYVQIYVDYVRAIGGKQEYEQQVSYEEWVPGGFGTSDAIIIDGGTIHDVDLKYGQGVIVHADDNPQGKLYGLGALAERPFMEFEKVVIHIVQPRLNHISTWETTPADIFRWADSLPDAVLATKDPAAPRVAGEHCRFCRAKPTCQARSIRAEHALMTEFESFAEKPRAIGSLTEEEIRFVLVQKPMIIDWLNSVEAHVEAKLLANEQFAGFKLVHGQSNRKWANEEEAEKELIAHLGDGAFTKKLLTITQAEKALGKEKKKIANLIVKQEGPLTMAPEDDKRPAAQITTANDFDF